MGYEEGLQAGKDIPSPIERLLGAVAGSYKKRREMREEQDKEERELQNELSKLTAIENVKSKHEREKTLLEGISKGDIEETTETGAGTFGGEHFGAMFEGKRYKSKAKTKPIYNFDPDTGKYYDPNTGNAVTEVEQDAVIRQLSPLTESEQNIIKAQHRMSGYLDEYMTLIQKPEISKSERRKFIAGKRIPFGYYFTGGTTERLKNAIDNLKADIPFSRGGKQLTTEEGRRIDILLDPSGKDLETIKKDIQSFKDEFSFGKELAIKGRKAIPQEQTPKSGGQITPEQAKAELERRRGQK